MLVMKIIGFVLVVVFIVGIVISNPDQIAIRYYGLELDYSPTLAETIIFPFLLGLIIATMAFLLDKSSLSARAKKQEKMLKVAQEEIARLRLLIMGEPTDMGPSDTPATPSKKTKANSTSIATAVPSVAPSTGAPEEKPRIPSKEKTEAAPPESTTQA
jgi:uncharacterized membrane protein YciS (DUF1049 family)